MTITSENIRDQSRKLSKIAPNFGRFFAFANFRGRDFQKLYPRHLTPDLRHVDWKKFHEDTPTRPEVIVAHTLNFRPNCKFSRLKFLGGHPSQFRCALANIGQSVARVKISGRSTPLGPKYNINKKCVLVGPYSHLNLCN